MSKSSSWCRKYIMMSKRSPWSPMVSHDVNKVPHNVTNTSCRQNFRYQSCATSHTHTHRQRASMQYIYTRFAVKLITIHWCKIEETPPLILFLYVAFPEYSVMYHYCTGSMRSASFVEFDVTSFSCRPQYATVIEGVTSLTRCAVYCLQEVTCMMFNYETIALIGYCKLSDPSKGSLIDFDAYPTWYAFNWFWNVVFCKIIIFVRCKISVALFLLYYICTIVYWIWK